MQHGEKTMTIGFAGVGRMSAAMAERLMEEGESVAVWNRSPGRTAPLVEKGAAEAETPAALAAMADTIITCLTNADAIEAVYGGPDGLLSADLSGKLVIEMSTVRPETDVALAAKVTAAGAAFVECPVGGTVGPARAGKLFGFAGGTEADVARARPVLDKLCRRVEHVGGPGAGATMKLAINLPLAVYWQALGEALALCKGLGLEGARLTDIFADTSGGANVMKVRGPALAEAIEGAKLPGTFDIDGMRKDLASMLAEGGDLGVDMPVARATLSAYEKASQAGLGQFDAPQQSAFWRETGGA
jgi:3-hydroxyisobutyrate dehydrogenase